MGSPHRSSSVLNRSHAESHRPSTSTAADMSSAYLGHERGGVLTRRGHSDGDILTDSPSGTRRQQQSQNTGDFTWSERQDHIADYSDMAARRRSVMIEDRRRRLSEAREAQERRTSLGSLSGRRAPHMTFGAFQPPRERASFGTPAGSETLISPAILNRPLPRRPSEEHARDRRSREIKLPKWQPDEDISECPICRTAFTFWYRKHHCRKCGRVVCANCSPHRITIPRQFIVHPPYTATSILDDRIDKGTEVVDLTGDGSSDSGTRDRPRTSDYMIDPALGGGQEVRLCNPCVPDPNPLPHMPYTSPPNVPFETTSRERETSSEEVREERDGSRWEESSNSPFRARTSQPFRLDSNISPSRSDEADFRHGVQHYPFASRHRHSNSFHPSNQAFSHPNATTPFGSAPDRATDQRILERNAQHQRPSQRHHRHHASMGQPTTTSRTFHMPELQPPFLRQPPVPQLREEDECPICHRELPPKGPDGSEIAREEHVTACIESHSSSSAPREAQPPRSAATEAAVAASGATPLQAAGRLSIGSIRPQNGSTGESADLVANRQRRRTTGMVIYNATEKDCVGENGEGEAECVICFEEFAVGDEMGRLECLCKFHRKCIRQWWDTKGPGACPVHQQDI